MILLLSIIVNGLARIMGDKCSIAEAKSPSRTLANTALEEPAARNREVSLVGLGAIQPQ